MAQNIYLQGTDVDGKVTVVGSVPSAADMAAATTPPILAAIAALKTDMDASFAAVEAAIAAIPVSPPPPPPPPPPVPTKYPASGAQAAFMPFVPPTTTPGAPAPKYSNPVQSGADSGPIAVPTTIPAGIFAKMMDIVNDTTVVGAGMESMVGAAAATIFDAGGLRPIYEKAIAVFEASATPHGATLSFMTFRGAAISQADGQNAAGCSNGRFGYNMTLDHVESYGNEQGLRGLGGNFNYTNCYIHHNGCDSCSSTGCTHNVYLNEDTSGGANPTSAAGNINVVTTSIFANALFAHEYKTRQPATTATGNVFDSAVIPGSGGSYSGGVTQLGGNGACFDNANGGTFTGSGNIYIKRAGVANHNFIQHNADAEGIGSWGGNYTETNGVFVNQTGTVTHIVNDGGTVTLVNPTFIGGRPDGNYVIQGTAVDLPATAAIPFSPAILALVGGTYPT